MLPLFNKIMSNICLEAKTYTKKSTVSSREYCKERQMYLAGLSRQFWMQKSNLSILRTCDILLLDMLFSTAIGSLTEEEGHQDYARSYVVLFFTMRSLLQPVYQTTLDEDLLASATDPEILIYLHSKGACSCLDRMADEARSSSDDVSDQKLIIKSVKCQVAYCNCCGQSSKNKILQKCSRCK